MSNLFKIITLMSLICFGGTQFAFAAINSDAAQLALPNVIVTPDKTKVECKVKKPTSKKCDAKKHNYHKHPVKKSNKAGAKSTTHQICLPPDCG